MAGDRPNEFRLGSYSVRWTRQIVWPVAKVWEGSVKAFSSYGILYFFKLRAYLLENGQKPKKQQKTPKTKLIFSYFDDFEIQKIFQIFFFSKFFFFKFFHIFTNLYKMPKWGEEIPILYLAPRFCFICQNGATKFKANFFKK